MRLLLLMICISFLINAKGQNSTPPPCTAPEITQFDFWVGEWKLTWKDSLHGTNHIEKKFGNCTLHEQFSDPRTGYLGESWTVYNPMSKLWQQTWIDNRGGYIALTGGLEGDKIVLKTGERKTATGTVQMRMVYHNIRPESFDWSWEASTDSGQTWKPNWEIHYERRK